MERDAAIARMTAVITAFSALLDWLDTDLHGHPRIKWIVNRGGGMDRQSAGELEALYSQAKEALAARRALDSQEGDHGDG